MSAEGKKVVAQILIRVWDDESLSIEGPMDHAWLLAALDHAKEAIQNQRRMAAERTKIVIPGRDVDPIVKLL